MATDVGGNAEIVADGRSGFLVEAGDHAALAGAMLRLEALPEGERRAMGAAGLERARTEYQIDVVARRWLEFYARFHPDRGADGAKL